MLRRGEAMVSPEVAAEMMERVLAGGRALAQAEQAVGELAAIVHKYGPDPHRAGPLQIPQIPAGVGGSLEFTDADEDPSGRPINRHE